MRRLEIGGTTDDLAWIANGSFCAHHGVSDVLGRAICRDDPAPFLELLRVVCEPILVDRPYDPRDYDVMERGLRASQITLSHGLYRAPGHQVFLLRALLGLDGCLRTFGTIRNWHRLFCEIVDAVPDAGGRTP